jgi:trehalose/maltose hydrolase-like predicted phosphorylase
VACNYAELDCATDAVLETSCPHTYKAAHTEDFGQLAFTIEARRDCSIQLTKYMVYHTSQTASPEELCGRAEWTMDRVTKQGFQEPLTAQEQYLNDFWCRSDVRVKDIRRMDLADIGGNVKDGCHIASMGGTWMMLTYGLGGMRDYDGSLSFWPRRAEDDATLLFTLTYREQRLQVEIGPENVEYTLREGDCLVIHHETEKIQLTQEHPVAVRPVSKS